MTKKQLIKKIEAIKKVAIETGMEGKLSITVPGSLNQYNALIDSLTGYPRYKHMLEIGPKLTLLIIGE